MSTRRRCSVGTSWSTDRHARAGRRPRALGPEVVDGHRRREGWQPRAGDRCGTDVGAGDPTAETSRARSETSSRSGDSRGRPAASRVRAVPTAVRRTSVCRLVSLTPLTLATCTNRTGSPPKRIAARPGVPRGSAAAALDSSTSTDSAGSETRRAMRRLVLALMSALTTPAGRWVARTRWTPSDRPRCAMPTKPWTKSGSSSARVANSSTTITSLGRCSSPEWAPPGACRTYARCRGRRRPAAPVRVAAARRPGNAVHGRSGDRRGR